jgi:transposase
MAYFLKKDKKKNGLYLQIYENAWVKELKQPRSKCISSIGYVSDLVSDEIPDPVSYYTEVVNQMNIQRASQLKDETRPRAFKKCVEKNVGYYLLSSLIDELDVKETIDILASPKKYQFSLYDMICQLIYSRVIAPCSKSRTVSSVFPLLYNGVEMSEDQVYDGCFFIGSFYQKYIELFNRQYSKYYERKYDNVYFDCTNYYFEIDLPYEDGPSKENQNSPIICQALLLDSDMIPVGMRMYPGNESEKPYLREAIDEMKQRYNVNGKTIQVADKGLNCARNIYAAVVESSDGYIFSKSVHGKNLSKKEKEWVLLENDVNVFENHTDKNGKLLYRLKSCVDTFEYSFEEKDPDTGMNIVRKFSVKEKRIVSYNPALAEKQKAEIMRMAAKACSYVSYRDITKEELGESSKYIKVVALDANGKKTKPEISVNQEKITEDLKFAGYNMLVTSEIDMNPQEIYSVYHNLWKIEESFRITKSFLDARPVYVQKKETIYGHFLICYLSLFLLRVLELKCFKGEVSTYDLIEFIRDFRVVDKGDDTYINISSNQVANSKIKKLTGSSLLDALILTKKEIHNLFNNTMLIDP